MAGAAIADANRLSIPAAFDPARYGLCGSPCDGSERDAYNFRLSRDYTRNQRLEPDGPIAMLREAYASRLISVRYNLMCFIDDEESDARY
ncbi:hypothetical protein, partial [Sphingomonas aquatilis]